MEYQKGRSNKVADAISCYPTSGIKALNPITLSIPWDLSSIYTEVDDDLPRKKIKNSVLNESEA